MKNYTAFRFTYLPKQCMSGIYLTPMFHILLYPKNAEGFWRCEFAVKFIKWKLAFNISNRAYLIFG